MHSIRDREAITTVGLPWVRSCLALAEEAPCVLVTLRQKKGSSPRESGARMVVGPDEIHGSIGGGNLEHQAILTSRKMLNSHRHPESDLLPRHPESDLLPRHPGNASRVVRDPAVTGQTGEANSLVRLEPYGLGPHLNQCCGGSVELLFEIISSPAPDWLLKLSRAIEQGDHAVLVTATAGPEQVHHVALPVGRGSELPDELQAVVKEMLAGVSPEPVQTASAAGCDWWLERVSRTRRQLWLFGAGHVGKAVVKTMADLPFHIRWMDSRDEEFPDEVPVNVTVVISDDLPGEVQGAPADTTFIVMTHSHELDEDICHAVMTRDEFAFLGMIGSVSKGRRFVHRLGKRGIPEATLERLVCPIGLPGIAGKEPATIALSLAAQLMSEKKE